jgi:hypothetical protein
LRIRPGQPQILDVRPQRIRDRSLNSIGTLVRILCDRYARTPRNYVCIVALAAPHGISAGRAAVQYVIPRITSKCIVPGRRALTEHILLGGAQRSTAIMGGTLVGAVKLRLRLWLVGLAIWAIGDFAPCGPRNAVRSSSRSGAGIAHSSVIWESEQCF